MTITDCHTHLEAEGAVVNVSPRYFAPVEGHCYSVGIHPWDLAEADEELWQCLVEAATSPHVVPLGETGLDALKGPSLDVQQRWFERHVALSEELQKPLIIHCVKAHHLILALHAHLRPTQPWVMHGFRGKPALAQQLLDAGLYLSLGPRFNEETARLIPDDCLLFESDDSGLPIDDVAARLASVRGIPPSVLLTHSTRTTTALFALSQ